VSALTTLFCDLARKHGLHRTGMKGGNDASLTLIFDKLFGTAE
jgi:hypothetical protein